VITRCLELDASKRPQQVADVRAGFQAPKRVRRAALARWVAGVAVAAALAGGAALWNREAPTSGSETPEVTRVTFDRGLADEPSVTADGKRMVYSSDKAAGGVSTIWVDELADGSSRMISKGDAHGTNPAISADGKWVVYRSERAGGGVYLVPAAGGEESLIAEDGRQPTFSPDGKRILYWTGQEGDSSMPSGKVWVFERETGKRTRYHEEFADARFPAWSPTGESILFRGSRGAGVRWNESADWYTTDGKRGAEATGAFAFLRKAGLTVHDARVFWAEDQILFSGRSGHSVNLWSLPVEGSKARIAGAVRALTTGTETESSPWLIGRGAVAYAHRRAFSHILRIPLKNGQPGQAEQTTLEEALDTRPSISDDGRRLLFTRWMGGVRTFLMLDVATGRQTPLLRDQPATPYLRPDGNEIAYSMPRGERNAVYVLAASGGEPKLLCDDCGEVAGWTGQGDRILFLTGTAGGVRGLSALDAATGARTELLPPMEGFSEASVSAQGVVAMAIRTGGTRSRIYVAKLGQEERVAVTDEAGWADKPRWAPDGKTLYFLSERDGFACVWRAAMGGDGRHPSRLEAVHHNHTRQHDLHHLSRPAQGLSVSANEVYLNVPNHTGSIWLMRMKEQRGVSFLSRLEGLLPNRGK
jgi:Tol biopolymer transport system component